MHSTPSKTVSVPDLQENMETYLDWISETKGRIYITDDSGEPTTVIISYAEAVYLGICDEKNNDGSPKID